MPSGLVLRVCSLVAGHPKATKVAIFDIISQDLQTGSSAAAAEAITVVNECLDSFANLDKYEIHLSHMHSEYSYILSIATHVLICHSQFSIPSLTAYRKNSVLKS